MTNLKKKKNVEQGPCVRNSYLGVPVGQYQSFWRCLIGFDLHYKEEHNF